MSGGWGRGLGLLQEGDVGKVVGRGWVVVGLGGVGEGEEVWMRVGWRWL